MNELLLLLSLTYTGATLHVYSHLHITWIRCINTTSNLYILCLQMRNVNYVSAFLSFDWSVCMYPGCTGSRKSQMSILSSSEPLMIWKSSNCRLRTALECSCDKCKRNHQSWALLQLKSQNSIHTIPDCTLIQSHSSRYSRCSESLSYWVWC